MYSSVLSSVFVYKKPHEDSSCAIAFPYVFIECFRYGAHTHRSSFVFVKVKTWLEALFHHSLNSNLYILDHTELLSINTGKSGDIKHGS